MRSAVSLLAALDARQASWSAVLLSADFGGDLYGGGASCEGVWSAVL